MTSQLPTCIWVGSYKMAGSLRYTTAYFLLFDLTTQESFCCLNLCMLTMKEYQALNEQQKADAIIGGTFLADREENGLIVQLYNVGLFYGELYYHPLANRVLRFRAFEGTRHLTPYLAHIKFNPR